MSDDNGESELEKPFDDGGNGKDERGRFISGNDYGRGAPPSKLRRALHEILTANDILAAVQLLRQVRDDPKAKNADRIVAAREILDRGVGRIDALLSAELTEISIRIQELRGG
jgi:hypothetical protein